MNPLLFCLILLGVMLNAGAQLLLKAGVSRIGALDFQFNNLLPMSWQMLTNLPIILGLCAYGVSVVVWLAVLSRADVSMAYPMVSLGYIVTAIAAYFLFTEPLSILRVTGIFVILLGVFMIARS